MGIDIYLNGYEEYTDRIKDVKTKFDDAVKLRDSFPRGSKKAENAQQQVERYADAMWAGDKCYIRSSYNGAGLFRKLEEIFGFDVANYLFAGDWDVEPGVPIDGTAFLRKVDALMETTLLAMSRSNLKLPWINEFSEVTGERAPDPNLVRSQSELFGDQVFAMFSRLGRETGNVQGGPSDPQPILSEDHAWYITTGLRELREFGLCAKRINEQGESTFAYISY